VHKIGGTHFIPATINSPHEAQAKITNAIAKSETAHDAKREIIGQVVCSCVFFSSGLLANRRDTSQPSE
jgi:hypothetical protein